MLEKLKSIRDRFEQLSDRIAAPDAMQDMEAWRWSRSMPRLRRL